MKNILYLSLIVGLSFGFAGCSSDKEDENTNRLKEEIRIAYLQIDKLNEKITKQESYCMTLPTNREQLVCKADLVTPLEKSKQFYLDRIAEIEKELGIK